MMIEDEELRNLFKTASEEHLQKLDDGLLYLEKHPNDKARLEELLREAHSLKGDARMLGVRDVETLIHQLEHILGSVKRGETTLESTLCDRMYQGLDAIRKVVHESVTGEPAGINTFHVLAQLMGANPTAPAPSQDQLSEVQETVEDVAPPTSSESPPVAESPPPTAPEKVRSSPTVPPQPDPTATSKAGGVREPGNRGAREQGRNRQASPGNTTGRVPPEHPPTPPATRRQRPEPAPTAASATGESVSLPPAPAFVGAKTPPTEKLVASTAAEDVVTLSGYRIETIRVETRNLDALMTQAGELTVTKIRISHQLAEIEEMVTLWEEWSRDTFVNRFALNGKTKHSQAGSSNKGVLTQLQNFHHRAEVRLEKLGILLNHLKNAASEDIARLDVICNDLEEGIRTLRLLPLSTIFQLCPRMVRDLAKSQAKEVELVIEGQDTKADKRILEEMKDPLIHILRNCIDHGIETPTEREAQGKPRVATIQLRGYQTATNIVIEVTDNGRGLDVEKIKQTALKRGLYREDELATMTPSQLHSLIFAPGFSTRTFVTEVSGRGVGLDVVRTNVERLKGNVTVESTPGKGCTFRMQLGTTLATTHVLIVEVNGISYALPVEFVQTTQLVPHYEIFAIEGRETIALDGQAVSVVRLAEVLELSAGNSQQPKKKDNQEKSTEPCIILKVGDDRLGVFVDTLLDEQDVVLKPQSKLLKRIRNVAGATILGTGEVCMILNPPDLIKSVQQRTTARTPSRPIVEVKKKPVILLAEDSIATRTQEKRILENAGYEVVTAVDGLDGFNKLKTRDFDAVVSDVQMPNLDGLGLAAKIRQNKEYNELPIILVTSLASDEDKRRGAEAGANAYITKGTFNQEVLLETLRRLI